MRAFTLKSFARWARKEGLEQASLWQAIVEIEAGQIDADLGGHVIKKRVPKAGEGKSGGWRTLLAYRSGDRAFFVYGFAKSDRGNINDAELKALKEYAKERLAYTEDQISKALKAGQLNEVKGDE